MKSPKRSMNKQLILLYKDVLIKEKELIVICPGKFGRCFDHKDSDSYTIQSFDRDKRFLIFNIKRIYDEYLLQPRNFRRKKGKLDD